MLNFKLKRIGMMMEPQAGNPNEVEGVLNFFDIFKPSPAAKSPQRAPHRR